MKFAAALFSTLVLFSPALAQDVSSIESDVSSVLSSDAGSVTVIAGHSITIPSGFSIPAIPTAVLSDTSLLDPLISSLTATLTGSQATEAASILSQITGSGGVLASSGASSAASATSSAASSTSSSGNGAISLERGAYLMVSVGTALVAGMWLL